MSNAKLDLARVLRSDAAEILAAREKMLIIHGTKDIKAAGAEVEEATRRVISRKVSASHFVGHGHIIDESGATSPQMDIVIADNLGSPTLFRCEDGSEYFPFEAVYAVGEVKSTYRKADKQIEAFTNVIAKVKQLTRAQTPKNYLRVYGGRGVTFSDTLGLSVTVPYQNPLFAFMLFANVGDFKLSDIEAFYASKSVEELPNVVCFLDKGAIVYALIRIGSEPADWKIHTIPEFGATPTEHESHWIFSTLASGQTTDAEYVRSLGTLYATLNAHLASCVLMPPNLLGYHQHAFGDLGSLQVFRKSGIDKS